MLEAALWFEAELLRGKDDHGYNPHGEDTFPYPTQNCSVLPPPSAGWHTTTEQSLRGHKISGNTQNFPNAFKTFSYGYSVGEFMKCRWG